MEDDDGWMDSERGEGDVCVTGAVELFGVVTDEKEEESKRQ